MEVREARAEYLAKPGVKQTEVGAIPADWDVIPVRDAGDVLGGRQRTPHAVGEATRYLRVANVFDGYIDAADVLEMPFTADEKQRFSLRPGDILLNEGQSLDLVGRSAIYRGQPSDCCFQNTLIRFRAGSKVVPEYAQAVFRQYLTSGVFAAIALQTTSIAHLGATRFASLGIAIPGRKEQQAIADALGDADALIESLEHLLAKKRQIKQGTMQALLTGHQRLPGFEGAWHDQPLQQICGMKSGTAITSDSIDNSSEYPCFGGNGIRGFTGTFTHDGDFVLVGRQGALCGNVTTVSGRFFASEHAIVVTPNRHLDFRWLALVLERMDLNQFSESSAQPGLSVEKLLLLECRVPEPDEQTAIATVLTDMDAEIAALEARLAKARALKQGMMQTLLTGRIRLV